MKNKLNVLFLSLITLTVISILNANPFSVPNIFSSGDTVSSSQMNANFAAINANLSAQIPVGTIISSILTPAQFATQAEDPSTFDATVSKWALADNRDVTGSSFASVTGSSTVVDLRGMFLRGVNSGRSDGNQDPGGARTAGSLQQDELESHNHSNGAFQYLLQDSCSDTIAAAKDNTCGEPNLVSREAIQASGGAETRPRNVAVYYYIRIN